MKMRYNEPDILNRVTGLIYLIVGLSVAVLIFASLIGTVATSITCASLTGASGTLAPLIIVVFVAGIVLAVFGLFMLVAKGKM